MTRAEDRLVTVTLTGLRATGHHGVLPFERRDGQEFVVDAELLVRRPDIVDDLTTTVDYGALAAALVADVERDPVDLIETLAGRLADTCLSSPLVERATVTVHKPHAPIVVPFDDVAVTCTRTRPATGAVLSLGGNVGDVLGALQRAVDELVATPGVVVTGVSSVHRTAPVGLTDQPDFLNIVVLVDTTLTPDALLDRTQAIEDHLGRTREVRWGPRTVDLDLIRFGDVVRDDVRLTLPHPRAHERAFVLVPWLEVDPTADLPGHGPVAALIADLDTSGVQRVDGVALLLP